MIYSTQQYERPKYKGGFDYRGDNVSPPVDHN